MQGVVLNKKFKVPIMKPDSLREHLIKAMSEQLPPGTNLAKLLSSLLYMGKEAVYRRLRGDVAFSFEEAAVISEKMDVSLDEVVHSCFSNRTIVEPVPAGEISAVDKYTSILENKISTLAKVVGSGRSEVGISSNSLPLSLLYRYPGLARFSFYRWLYQYGVSDLSMTFSQVSLPAGLVELQNEYTDRIAGIDYIYYIWSDRLFASLTKDIGYFVDMRLMKPEEASMVVGELMSLAEDMERLASRGGYREDKRVEMYVSSTNIDSTYIYLDAPTVHLSLIRIFSMDTIISREKFLCEGFKAWVKSQKRVSMLISGSGEPQKVKFFRTQRDILSTVNNAIRALSA